MSVHTHVHTSVEFVFLHTKGTLYEAIARLWSPGRDSGGAFAFPEPRRPVMWGFRWGPGPRGRLAVPMTGGYRWWWGCSKALGAGEPDTAVLDTGCPPLRLS